MHTDLEIRRRVLISASQGFERADLAWRTGLRDAARFVPDAAGRGYWKIGHPGSRIRALYEERARALDRLAAVRLKLLAARAAVQGRQPRPASQARTILVTYRP